MSMIATPPRGKPERNAGMRPKLTLVAGKADKAEIRLKLPTIVGRTRDAGLMIAHKTVSRRHCELFERHGMLFVRDTGSRNGTLVDNSPIKEAMVKPGHTLTVGPLTFAPTTNRPIPSFAPTSRGARLQATVSLLAQSPLWQRRRLAPRSLRIRRLPESSNSKRLASTTARGSTYLRSSSRATSWRWNCPAMSRPNRLPLRRMPSRMSRPNWRSTMTWN